jgi:hypothetical protein
VKQLTVRGFPPALERRLRSVARERGISLNRAALHLMARGAGVETDEAKPDCVGDALDRFIGSWSAEREREFREAVRDLDRVDEDLWR